MNAPFRLPSLPPRDPRFAPVPSELCHLATDWKPGPLPHGYVAEEKHDGIRALWTGRELLSREGEPIACAAHIVPELERLQRRFGQPMFFDGEYCEPGGFLETIRVHSSRGKREARGVLHLFDALPLEEWCADSCQMPYTARRALLRVAMDGWEPKHIRIVSQRPVASRADVEGMAAEIWARGGEGVLVKDGASLYRRKRSSAWQKHKRKLELTGRLVEVLKDGAAAKVEIGGRTVRVSVAMGMRGRLPAVGICVRVEAMEWTERLQLRQGLLVRVSE